MSKPCVHAQQGMSQPQKEAMFIFIFHFVQLITHLPSGQQLLKDLLTFLCRVKCGGKGKAHHECATFYISADRVACGSQMTRPIFAASS